MLKTNSPVVRLGQSFIHTSSAFSTSGAGSPIRPSFSGVCPAFRNPLCQLLKTEKNFLKTVAFLTNSLRRRVFLLPKQKVMIFKESRTVLAKKENLETLFWNF